MKFLVDQMVGRLGRWLRILGCDAASVERDVPPEAIAYKSLQEERILLAKNMSNSRRKVYGLYGVRGEIWREQVPEVMKHFGLLPDPEKIFTRCPVCNVLLEKKAKAEIEKGVPAYVLDTTERFFFCPSCLRVYWHGSHRELLDKTLKAL